MTDVLYPRAFVQLNTTVVDRDVTTGMVPTRASFTRRSFQQADECEATVMGATLPWSMLAIEGAHIALFMGNAGAVDERINDSFFVDDETGTNPRLRFVGFVDEVRRIQDDRGEQIELRARDYSSLLRDFKPLAPEFVPRYSDTLRQAIQKILNGVESVMRFGEKGREFPLSIADMDVDPPLSGAIHSRGHGASIQLQPDSTAWTYLGHVCGIVNRIPTVELDKIVVRDPNQSYTGQSRSVAQFAFGRDYNGYTPLLKVEQTKRFLRNRRGIRMTSWDPLTRTTLVAEVGDHSVRMTRPIHHAGNQVLRGPRTHRAPSHNPRRATTTVVKAAPKDEFEVLAAPSGVCDQSTLNEIALGVYNQRKHGELEGKLETPFFDNELLTLKHGDRFDLFVEPTLAAQLRNVRSDQERARRLAQIYGLSEDAMSLLIQSADEPAPVQFFLRSMTAEYVHEGRSDINIEFIRLLVANLDETHPQAVDPFERVDG